MRSRHSTMKRAARAAEFLAWAAFFAAAVLALALRLWLLPEIDRYRDEIAGALSRSVGQPVRIGGLQARWTSLHPRLRVSDVRVYDGAGREVLALPAVEATLAWRSVLRGAVELRSLAIERPHLSVRRDAEGTVSVAGVRLEGAGGARGVGGWLLAQREIVVRDAHIEWQDDRRGAPPLVLSAVELRMRNAGGERAIGLTGRPPEALGAALDLRALGAAASDPAHWSGRLYVALGATDLAAWRPWVHFPFELSRGEGALRLWLGLERGEVHAATLDVAASGVRARLAPELAPLEIGAIHGRLQARAGAEGYVLAGRGLALTEPGGASLAPADFRASWRPAAAGSDARGAFSASLLELEPLARLAAALPFPAQARRLLADVAPRGRLAELKLDWSGEIEAPARYRAGGRFEALSAAPWQAVPGFGNLAGRFETSEEGGWVQLAARRGHVELPAVLPQPRIALDFLDGRIDWERSGERDLRLRVPSLSLSNAHFSGNLHGTYLYPGGGPGIVDLSVQFNRADGAHTARYLPHAPLLGGQETRDWIARAVLGGYSEDVRVRLQGDLREFPFRDPRHGQFSVRARVDKGVLEYAPGWPRIEEIRGELLFERDRMEVTGRSAAVLGVALANVRVAIPRLDDAEPRVLISGEAHGETAGFLRFIQASPVRAMIDRASDAVTAAGSGRLRLKVDLPLADSSKTRVAGEYDFAGNRLVVHERLPPIERAGGRLAFTEASVVLHGLQGQLFGGPVSVSGGTRREGGLQLLAKGEAAVAGLRPLLDHPWLERLSGAAPYVAVVQVAAGGTRARFESSLEGVASGGGRALAKAAGENLPLRVELAPSG
ncbi:MAG TPA: DUF3971 domain-containing protein, partial [Burkholderiales bacterium]|nr:DUF3971 domain-containing protein [Burkholderiales bacterium]